ncbi:adenylosuccinate synthetase, partial [Francisella tularensis subsp. holarctica]
AFRGIVLYKVEPILVVMEPFSIDETVKKDNLPASLKTYLKTLENQVGIQLSSLVYGQSRENIFFFEDYF